MENNMIFENRYYADTAVIKEYVKHIFCKWTRRMGITLMIISGMAFGVSLFLDFEMSDSALFLACFLGGLMIYLYYYLVVKSLQKQSRNLHNGKLPEVSVKFGDVIEMSEGKVSMEIQYSQIVKVFETPNLYALMIGKNQSILVVKQGFTKGTEENFKEFITEKIAK